MLQFTENDVLRYILNEMNKSERAQMKTCLATNDAMRSVFIELKLSLEMVEQIRLKPSNSFASRLHQQLSNPDLVEG
jgi:hypothetical protein